MRHRVSHRRLARTHSERKALFRNMATSLLRQQRIKTTLAKAKELRSVVEHLITLAKEGDLAAARRAYKLLGKREVVSFLFKEIGPLFKKRAGGYTRILRLANPRAGDCAQMVFIELTEKRITQPQKPEKKKTRPEERPKQERRQEPEPAEEVKPEEKPAKPAERPKEEKIRPAERPKPKEGKKPASGFFEGLKKFFKKDR